MHSSLMCSRVRDNMGHANIDVTQNVYGKNWWEERVDALTRAVEALSAATQNAEKAEAKPGSAGIDQQRMGAFGCPSRKPRCKVAEKIGRGEDLNLRSLP